MSASARAPRVRACLRARVHGAFLRLPIVFFWTVCARGRMSLAQVPPRDSVCFAHTELTFAWRALAVTLRTAGGECKRGQSSKPVHACSHTNRRVVRRALDSAEAK